MQRSTWVNVWLGVVVLATVLATATVVSAQSVVDAGRVEFTPSTDHNALDPTTGVPLLESYSFKIFLAGGTTPVQTVSLGKPTPQTDGMIRLDFVSLLSTPLTPGVIYESQVAAIGPGGSAASTRSNTFAFSPACAPSISPTSQSVAATGGTGSTTVTAGAGCAWTAVTNVAWISVTTGASGSGSGTVTFSVAANAGTTSRMGTLTVAGRTFTITQAAASCSYTIAPTSANAVPAGITGSVAVTVAAGCAWTATSNASWITISAGASGSGNGSVIYSVAAHTGTAPRTGTLTAAGKTFTISQAPISCSYTIAPTSANVAAAGGTGTVSITTASGCSWSATSGSSWVTISSGASGTGSGSVGFTAEPNTTTAARTATLTIAGKTFLVTESRPAIATPSNFRIIK